jgi:hypothetical protein
VSIPRWYLNLFIVFAISGLWHGANWTFVIWGALHGFYLVFSLLTKDIRAKVSKALYLDKIPILPTIITFVLVSFAWIFFRANNVESAFYISKHILTGIPDLLASIMNNQFTFDNLGVDKRDLILSFLLIIFLETVHYFQNKVSLSQVFLSKPAFVRWSLYFGVILVILLFGVFESRQFIYFQF